MRVAALLPPSFHKEDNMNTENIIDIAINFNDPEWILKGQNPAAAGGSG